MSAPGPDRRGREPAASEAARAIEAAGTDEREWAAWTAPGEWPEPALPEGPVLVLAAHPDDEVLGFGGTAARLAAERREVHVLTATDGEASHPGSRVLPPEALARARRRELAEALDALGVDRRTRHRLALADTRVGAHETVLARTVAELLRSTGAGLCVAPWRGDLHADHEAVGRAARTAAASVGVPLWQYPVWMWHWAVPEDARVPWTRCHRLPLSAAQRARKRAAVHRFRTQTAPLPDHPAVILPPEELAHHQRDFETVIVETDLS
ncbi:PIG-L deacetylase family protein [Streptomyces albidoflavus]|uniref:PIG-L deacetylase family protein n=1 Tax=Streptomyces albidoflavus TaxID=1886 RepID=UPI00024944D1|nr:PIG-L family deacetylase [Streptomyces albidoflavus]RZD79466.1 PIG-L family deacetylase [Streptomyces albidoflavus]